MHIMYSKKEKDANNENEQLIEQLQKRAVYL